MAEITLYNQDCIAAMKQIDAESIDLIVTDPPYNLGNFMKKRDTNLKKMRDIFFGSAGWTTWNLMNGQSLWMNFSRPLQE